MDGAWLIVLAVGLIIVTLLIHELTSVDRALRRRALHDYNAARGTQHRKQLQHSVQVLRPRRDNLTQERTSLQTQVVSLNERQGAELERILVKQTVEARLGEIRGLGPSLVSDIIKQCFNGSLSSLNRAYIVRGIGSERQAAISKWVRSVESQLPNLLKRDFPGKQDVVARYQSEKDVIEKRISSITRELARLESMEQKANDAIAQLSRVGPTDFANALQRGAVDQNQALAEHLSGIFPEWEPVPAWYADLLKEVAH